MFKQAASPALAIVDEEGAKSGVDDVTVCLTRVLIDVFDDFEKLLQIGRAFVEAEILAV